MELFTLGFMRAALVAAVLVGVAAPLVGVFLVQRRMSLIGDGLGHVALAGVAVGVLTGSQPVFSALICAVLAAVAIELIRIKGHANADVALSVMFYGGIALGVVLIGKSPAGSPAGLTGYLFGAILTTSTSDLVAFAILAAVVLAVTVILRQRLFAVANDEEYAQAVGISVIGYNITLAALTAVTVVVSMRVVGLLLISALMILPNAAAQLLARSFAASVRWAAAIGVLASAGGVLTSYYADTATGGTIVLLAIAIFLGLSALAAIRARRHRRLAHRATDHPHEHRENCGHQAVPHGDHVDYLHDGHRHAPHGDHYDEHGDHPKEHGHPLEEARP